MRDVTREEPAGREARRAIAPAHRRLAELFGSDTLIGPPPTEELVELMALMFTAEEAALALHVPPYRQQPAGWISRRAGVALDDAVPLLEAMASRRVIHRGRTGYCLVPLLPGLYEKILMGGDETEFHREFARRMNALFSTGYMKGHIGSPTQTVRTIPVDRAVGTASTPLEAERVEAMIAAHHEMAVLHNCQCRQATKLNGRPCTHADAADGCLAFGSFARFFVGEGGARFVSRDEMRRVVREREERQLVFFTGNVSASSPNLICTCCDCCCRMLDGIIRPSPGILVAPPPVLAEVDEARCTSCGRCATACTTGAHRLEAKRHVFELSRCVGCGLCVRACEEHAIRPVPNPRHRPPARSFTTLALTLAPAKVASVALSKANRLRARLGR
jgi:ferredoxin